MKCSKCGYELQDGITICPRCGARQNSSGSNNLNKNNKSKKGGSKKIIAAAGFLILFAVALVLGVSLLNNKKEKVNDGFTHNTTFEKDNLSVTDNQILRYRDVDKTKSFSIGSDIGYADVSIVDENGSEVNFLVDKNENGKSYTIKPNNYWEDTHTYFMTLGKDTFFTDEDIYQFKEVIYTVKKENPSEPSYKLNSKIVNLSENPNAEIKDGDVVIYIGDDGNETIGKVDRIENGNPIYVEPSLVEMFEELKIDEQNFYPDYSTIIWNEDAKQTLMHKVKNSNFFDSLMMVAYASDYFDIVDGVSKGVSAGLSAGVNKRELSINAKEIDNICKISINASEELGDGNELSVVDSNLKQNKYLKLTLGFELSPYEGKLFGREVDDDVKAKIEFSKKIAVALKCKVDIGWFKVNAFDFQILNHSEDGTKIELSWSKDGSDDENEDAVITNKIDTIFVNKEDILDTEEIIPLLKVPINIAGPVGFEFDLSLKGNFLIEGKFNLEMTNETTSRYGLELIRGELVSTKILEKGANTTATLEGKMEAKVGISPSFHLFIGILGINPVDVSINGELGIYGRSEGSFTVANNNVEFASNSRSIDEYGNQKQVSTNNRLNDATVSSKISMEAGIYADVYLNGKVVIIAPLLDSTIRLFYNEFPFAQISREDDFTNDITATSIGAVGSIHKFGPYNFKVLDKDEDKGIALLLATEGLGPEKYYTDDSNGNINISYSWADSHLRDYLNNDFINKFDTSEKNSLYLNNTVAEMNNKYNLSGGDNCDDKIFILSKMELEKYLKSDSDRQLKASSEAVSKGAYVSTETDPERHRLAGNTIYWVRNPGDMFNVMAVNSDGSISEEGTHGSQENVCVRPAMWVRYTIKRDIKENLKDITKGLLDKTKSGHGGR